MLNVREYGQSEGPRGLALTVPLSDLQFGDRSKSSGASGQDPRQYTKIPEAQFGQFGAIRTRMPDAYPPVLDPTSWPGLVPGARISDKMMTPEVGRRSPEARSGRHEGV